MVRCGFDCGLDAGPGALTLASSTDVVSAVMFVSIALCLAVLVLALGMLDDE